MICDLCLADTPALSSLGSLAILPEEFAVYDGDRRTLDVEVVL